MRRVKIGWTNVGGRAGTWGEFVHHNNPLPWADMGCPFCGCTSYFAFCFESIKTGEWSSISHPDDAFECANCGAVHTRGIFDGHDEDELKLMMNVKHRVRVGRRYYNV